MDGFYSIVPLLFFLIPILAIIIFILKGTGILQKINNALHHVTDPLSDPVVKTYFEIICGMVITFKLSGNLAITGNIKAKKYVEYFIKQSCDEAKLEKALELYNLSRNEQSSNKIDSMLCNHRRSIRYSHDYLIDDIFEAYRTFYSDELYIAQSKYDYVIDVIKDDLDFKKFEEGTSKIGSSQIVSIVMYDRFCEGCPVTRRIILNYLYNKYFKMYSSEYEVGRNVALNIALFTIKAMHFEKYGFNTESYNSNISEEEFRNFVLTVEPFKTEINKHPFDTEKYTNDFIKSIRDRSINDFWDKQEITTSTLYVSKFDIIFSKAYLCDLACYLAWKEAKDSKIWLNNDEVDISESKKYQDVFIIMFAFLTSPYDIREYSEFEEFDEPEGLEKSPRTSVKVENYITDEQIAQLNELKMEIDDIDNAD